MRGRTSLMSLLGVQVAGLVSMTLPTCWSVTLQPFLAKVWMTSRKVNIPASRPWSMTAREPMSKRDMVSMASRNSESGAMV